MRGPTQEVSKGDRGEMEGATDNKLRGVAVQGSTFAARPAVSRARSSGRPEDCTCRWDADEGWQDLDAVEQRQRSDQHGQASRGVCGMRQGWAAGSSGLWVARERWQVVSSWSRRANTERWAWDGGEELLLGLGWKRRANGGEEEDHRAGSGEDPPWLLRDWISRPAKRAAVKTDLLEFNMTRRRRAVLYSAHLLAVESISRPVARSGEVQSRRPRYDAPPLPAVAPPVPRPCSKYLPD
jgi:hypothetical protein